MIKEPEKNQNITATPSGMPLFLPIKHAYSLISRFKGKVPTDSFWHTFDGYYYTKEIFFIFIFVMSLIRNYDPYEYILYFIIFYYIGLLVSFSRSYIFGGIILLAMLYSKYLKNIFYLVIVVACIYFSRYDILIISFALKFILEFFTTFLELKIFLPIFKKKFDNLDNVSFNRELIYFINTYYFYAKSLKISQNLDLTEEEKLGNTWENAYLNNNE